MARRRPIFLYDARGNPFNATAAAWDAAGQGRRARGWAPTTSSINALLGGDVETLRRRTRDAVRKNGWAESGLGSYVSNTVGNGIVPRSMAPDEEFRAELMEAWNEFVDEADADGTSSFYGLQALACRAFREGGDCFLRFRPRRASDGLSVPLQLQILEAEMLDPAFTQDRGKIKIKAGIEIDAVGRRLAYHLFRDHPGELTSFRRGERSRIPAANVIHVYQLLRPGQLRGVPGLASVLATLYELDRYEDAELMRKQTAALFAGFITKPDQDSNPLGFPGAEGLDADDVPIAALEPGTMQELGPGEHIEFSKPPEDRTYRDFIKAHLRKVAAGSGVTYEQLTGDYENVTFSSARMALIQFRRSIEQVQRNLIIFQLCRPVWQRFFKAAVLSRRVTVPRGFTGTMRQLMRAKWTATPGWEYVDPKKEIESQVLAVANGFTSRSKIVMEHGWDPEELDREIAADNERADQLDLRFGGTGGGNAIPEPAEPDEDEEVEERDVA